MLTILLYVAVVTGIAAGFVVLLGMLVADYFRERRAQR